MPDNDEEKPTNLATTLASLVFDAAKMITGVPLDYPDPLLTPLAKVPQPAKEEEEPIMDDGRRERQTARGSNDRCGCGCSGRVRKDRREGCREAR